MSDHTYDVIVLGAGPAGENAADLAARDGLRVAIVERELVGGECSYWGCMPSKGLLRPGEALDEVRRTPGARAAVTGSIDLADALARRDALAGGWDDAGQVAWLDGVGVDLIRGHGRLAGERTVEVQHADGTTDRYVASRAVVIATGSSAARPPIDGLDRVRVWDNRDATTVTEPPRRLLVVGGGAIGVEMAQAWSRLGSDEVTIVEFEERLLPREEPFAGRELQTAFEREGIAVHVGSRVKSLSQDGERGPIEASVVGEAGAFTIEVDEVLIATGRRPNTSDLGLETIGLEPGRYLDVDEHLRVRDVPGGWLYAVGDVNGRALLTHTGKYQARIAGAHIRGLDTAAWGDVVATPRVVFTGPEVAAVGLTTEAAEAAGLEVRTVDHDIGHVAAAAVLGKGYRGTCRLVIDASREVIVGATFVGPRAGELLHAATIAIVSEVPLGRLWHAIPAFPTLSEVWLRLLEAYRDTFGVEFV